MSSPELEPGPPGTRSPYAEPEGPGTEPAGAAPSHPIMPVDRVAEMRRLFDESFAAPPPAPRQTSRSLLAIVVGGQSMAVDLTDIISLATVRGKVLAVPSSVPELIGLTGIRGTLVPVFSLAALLSLDPRGSAEAGEPRWLLLCGSRQTPVALAFDQFEKHLQIEASEIFSAEALPQPGQPSHALGTPVAGEGRRPFVGEVLRHDGVPRAIINVAQIVAHLTARGAASR